MVKDQYLEKFDLSAEDSKLRILNCSREKKVIKELQNIQIIDPKQLPVLTLEDYAYDLALCSEILFIDGENLSENYHVDTILELARVASEVRIYPVTDKEGKPSIHLAPVIQTLQLKGFGVELRQVKSHAEKESPVEQASNVLLKIWQESCVLRD
jgi:hypothetical protein